MTPDHTITVPFGERSYDILIGSQLLDQACSYGAAKPLSSAKTSSALIVTNTAVARLYLQTVIAQLGQHHRRVLHIALPDGESHKSWDSLNLIFDVLLQNACDKHTVLYALGGGVVGDMTGFAASCYMRGVAFVQIPTTLLSQVDSSVGGKTAINHPLGKNMIGAFYQPTRVVCDLSVLTTLPKRELAAGLAEVIKYGPIADMDFFAWLESNMDALLALEPSALAHAVRRSCEIKARIVAQDERDVAIRATLNFGHTFGHAIEAAMGYGAWLHGEGVACGMVMAAHLSLKLGHVDRTFVDRLTHLIARAGLPIVGPQTLLPQDYLHHMQVDKKNHSGQIQFIVIDKPGHATLQTADDALVQAVIEQCTAKNS